MWKTIRIFISSTFRDMHAERDFLVRVVFPELKERCAKRQLHLIDVDLRWGVTEEEAKEGKVIEICLDEIERCHPFFIGLLGERYGWTPEEFEVSDDKRFDWLSEFQGHSVTALEIYHGVLLDEEMKTRAFFYFRDAAFLKDVPDEKRSDFLPESDDAAQKLEVLKKEIKAKCPVFENYPCAFDGLDENGKVKLARLEEFGRRILEDLWAAICLEHPADAPQPDDLAIERAFHENFIENRTTRFIGRRDVLDALEDFAAGDDENDLVVTGAAGCGKSAVLAEFAKDYAEKHADSFVLTHFIGVSPGSTDVRRTLLRLCRELKRKFEIQEEIPTDYYELRQTFVKILEQAGEQGKVLLVVDALNQLDAQHFAHHLDWLPSPLPKGAKLIVSTLEGDCLDSLRRRSPQPREVEVRGLTEEERKEIVVKTLEAFGKHLEEKPENDQMGLLLEKAESDNPLFLIVACEEMRVYGDFDTVSVKLESLAEQVETLFGQVLERVESDHGRELVKDALALLECSRYGLLESEMLELLARDGEKQLPQAVWARFYRSLKFYLRPSGSDENKSGEGLLDFFHRQLSKAVRQKYLTDKETEINTHKRLARYFQRKADSSNDRTWSGNYRRGLSELAHHQLAGKLYDDLFQIARDETFLTKQADAFSADPQLQLQTLQNAIIGAAKIDDAAKMAEFVLSHARRVQSMHDASPLDALRKGNFERAWELADLYEIELSILWYLLIAWELNDVSLINHAKETLERLSKKTLPRLSGWKDEETPIFTQTYFRKKIKGWMDYKGWIGKCGAYLLSKVFETQKNETVPLVERLLTVDELSFFFKQLVASGYKNDALEIAQKIPNSATEHVLQEIGISQAQSGDIKAAMRSIQAMEPEKWNRKEIFAEIAIAQVKKGYFSAAKTTIEFIDYPNIQAKVLAKTAVIHFQSGNIVLGLKTFGEAKSFVRRINIPWQRNEAFRQIAVCQIEAGNLNLALKTVEQIDDAEIRTETLADITVALAQIGEFKLSLKFLSDIRNIRTRVLVLSKIARAFAAFGDIESAQKSFETAIQTALDIDGKAECETLLGEIAVNQAQSGKLYDAIQTLANIDYKGRKANVLSRIAIIQGNIADNSSARDAFGLALQTSLIVDYAELRTEVLQEIAVTHVMQKPNYDWMNEPDLLKTSVDRIKTEKGAISSAVQLAQKIESLESRAMALCLISISQAKSGDVEGADKTFKTAFKTANQMQDMEWRPVVLRKMVTSQAQVGDVGIAIRFGRKIGALYEIAVACIAVGLNKKAMNIVDQIINDRNECLPEIAAALTDANDKENFKYLLVSCAYYLDAAYRLSGLLARLYPEQSDAITKVIRDFS